MNLQRHYCEGVRGEWGRGGGRAGENKAKKWCVWDLRNKIANRESRHFHFLFTHSRTDARATDAHAHAQPFPLRPSREE